VIGILSPDVVWIVAGYKMEGACGRSGARLGTGSGSGWNFQEFEIVEPGALEELAKRMQHFVGTRRERASCILGGKAGSVCRGARLGRGHRSLGRGSVMLLVQVNLRVCHGCSNYQRRPAFLAKLSLPGRGNGGRLRLQFNRSHAE